MGACSTFNDVQGPKNKYQGNDSHISLQALRSPASVYCKSEQPIHHENTNTLIQGLLCGPVFVVDVSFNLKTSPLSPLEDLNDRHQALLGNKKGGHEQIETNLIG